MKDEDRDNFIISRLIDEFTQTSIELSGKYGDYGTVPVYTALSVLICKLAVIDEMPAHTLMEGILKTYRKFEQKEEA